MSAILKNFKVKLTRNQQREIEQELAPLHGRFYTLAIQVRRHLGPFKLTDPSFHIAVLSEECGDAIQAVIESHRPKAPAPAKEGVA